LSAGTKLSRFLWFVGLWTLGVATVGITALVIRFVLKS